ncbi:MAG TPA: Uma2 family endonuclease [Polyangiaceae bacterium]|nr:Uma2 family endonuclease [Polyangiaceae bacterium]
MADSARRRANYDDLRDVPPHLIAEILQGELVTSPRPGPPHAQAASSLAGELYAPFHRGRGGPGGWIILNEPELHLRGDILVPDIAGWRRERMPALPVSAAFELAPDWICEVLSASTASTDRAVKVPIYAREKIGHIWLVDPVLQILEVLRLDGPGYRIAGVWRGDVTVQCEPFETLPIRLLDLWSV